MNDGPGRDIPVRNTPAVTVGVGIWFPSEDEAMMAVGIRPGLWIDQSWDFGAGARLRLVNTFTYGWELNAWGGNTMVISDVTNTPSGRITRTPGSSIPGKTNITNTKPTT